MSIDFEYPLFLTPKQLDELLEKGWFRMHESVFTTHYYMREGKLLSTVWLRSPLKEYRFSKGQRKRLRSMHRRYDIRITPLRLGEEHEQLYTKYYEVAKGKRSNCIADILGDASELVFQTRQLEIRDQGKLIGFSIFDIGLNSLQSILGIYDPEYATDSLGVMTMLLEVEFAIQNQFHFYYIGYFTPNCSAFDYKLRLGNLEFYNPDTERWYALKYLKEEHLWSSIHEQKLRAAETKLKEIGIASQIFLNVNYDTVILNALGELFIDAPLCLDIRVKIADRRNRVGYLCYYSVHSKEYSLYLVDFEARKRIGRQMIEESEGYPSYTTLIQKTHLIERTSDLETLFSTLYFS